MTFFLQRRVVPKERALSKEGVPAAPTTALSHGKQSYAYNGPLLFVIPSEAEESAVRPSGAPLLSAHHFHQIIH